jgi:uncharacterized protein YjbJ (UPF0337 family)
MGTVQSPDQPAVLFVDAWEAPGARGNYALAPECSQSRSLLLERQERMMKPSTRDKTEGKLHEVKGKIKEEVGKATNDPQFGSLREEGKESWQSSKMDRPR